MPFVNCDYCGKRLFRSPRFLRMFKRFFCDASHKALGSGPRGNTHHRWKGGVDRRGLGLRARKIFGNVCARCSWKEAPCDAHHIVARSAGGSNELTNIIILCPNCHRLADFGIVTESELRTIWDQKYGSIRQYALEHKRPPLALKAVP